MTDFTRAAAFVRQRGAGFGIEVLVNFVAPFLIYDLGKASLGEVHALMASSGPPIAWSLVEFARRRRVDALSILVLGGIALSLLAFMGGGGVRFLQLRERLVTGLIGLIFLGSAAIGRPLIFEIARAAMRRRSESEAASFEALRENAAFRRSMSVITLVWGFGLVVDTAVGSLLVFSVSVREYLLVSPVLGYATTGALALWTFWYVRRRRRMRLSREAAETAAVASPVDRPPERA